MILAASTCLELEPADQAHDSISSFTSTTSRAYYSVPGLDEDIVMPSQSSAGTTRQPSPTIIEGISKHTDIDQTTAGQPDTCQETQVQSMEVQPETQTQAGNTTQMKERDPTEPCDCGSKVTHAGSPSLADTRIQYILCTLVKGEEIDWIYCDACDRWLHTW